MLLQQAKRGEAEADAAKGLWVLTQVQMIHTTHLTTARIYFPNRRLSTGTNFHFKTMNSVGMLLTIKKTVKQSACIVQQNDSLCGLDSHILVVKVQLKIGIVVTSTIHFTNHPEKKNSAEYPHVFKIILQEAHQRNGTVEIDQLWCIPKIEDHNQYTFMS